MMAIEILAVAIGVVSFVLLALISVRGPRRRSARLSGSGGPLVPIGDDDGDGDGDAK